MSRRIKKIIQDCIEHFRLDLSDLTVFTEAASGNYLYTPIIAACAGARKVYAKTRDSRYGLKEDIREQTVRTAKEFGVADRIEVIYDAQPAQISDCNIVTNSGFVRPINKEMIRHMNDKAVVPLMWETWEYREEQLDLAACQNKGVLVLGTWESKPPLDLRPYGGVLGFKLIFELGLELHQTRILLLGGQPTLGEMIFKYMQKIDVDTHWFSADDENGQSYDELAAHFSQYGHEYDAIIVADHKDQRLLLGSNGVLKPTVIQRANPSIRIGVISGHVDAKELRDADLFVFPDKIAKKGMMSYQANDLGPRPALELYSAGLKVGQEMARARLRGLDLEAAKQWALEHSPAMDFD